MIGSFKDIFKAHGDRGEPQWLSDRRSAAMARFEGLGIPTTRLEEWKYTNLRALGKLSFVDAPGSVAAAAAAQLEIKDLDAIKIVFVDGRHAPELSDLDGTPEGLIIGSLATFIAEGHEGVDKYLGGLTGQDRAFAALNEALFVDGLAVRISRNTVIEKPIHVVHIATERAADEGAGTSFSRHLIVAETGSKATILETCAGPASGPHLANSASEVYVGDNAELSIVRLQNVSRDAFGVHHLDATVGRDARFRAFCIDLGGALIRNEVRVLLESSGGECDLGGLYPLTGRQHVDNFTLVDHRAPHCYSRQLYKALLHDKSRGVFQGKVHVRQEAQKTNAEQSNPNILLSPGAVADTKPMLEIYADDVRCTHGATVGQLDENPELLFYLRSRGIPPARARWLLTRAFAQEVVQRIADITGLDAVEARLEALVAARLEHMTDD